VVKPLAGGTWDAFARLVERHNGVFGGCWCTWFHTFDAEKTFTAEGNHALKEQLVEEDRADAALVFEGDEAVAWASTALLRNSRTSTAAEDSPRGTGSCLPAVR